jgi:hypothetical protein
MNYRPRRGCPLWLSRPPEMHEKTMHIEDTG